MKFLLPVQALSHALRNRDALHRQVVAHAVGIVGVDGDVIELAFASRRLVEELDPLPIVDLDESDLDRAVRLGQRERLVETEEVPVERSSFRKIADEDREVRHAENLRARHEPLRWQHRGQTQGRSDEGRKERLHPP